MGASSTQRFLLTFLNLYWFTEMPKKSLKIPYFIGSDMCFSLRHIVLFVLPPLQFSAPTLVSHSELSASTFSSKQQIMKNNRSVLFIFCLFFSNMFICNILLYVNDISKHKRMLYRVIFYGRCMFEQKRVRAPLRALISWNALPHVSNQCAEVECPLVKLVKVSHGHQLMKFWCSFI